MELKKEINRRRTFAVISHPDAGKTTLTEKLLLFGGAIHVAGAVKSNKIKKTATSDFMEIERQRGISVATSVMGFEYNDFKINILDTPGHEDFAEHTYRTLTAVDSVIVVVDVAKGVEKQTRKLMEVCRMRNTPVIIFVNKLDRLGKDPFELMDELETELKIGVRPLSWPIGMGDRFKGVYNLYDKNLNLFTTEDKYTVGDSVKFENIEDPTLSNYIGEEYAEKLREEIELIEGVYSEDYLIGYKEATVAPVFFGSALNNFGVKEMLDCFTEIAPPPGESETETRTVSSFEEKFSGFVFKIHANMDPNHRNRIAFLKICSGVFKRNTNYHHVRLGRDLKFSNPTAFMAQKKNIIEDAFPGDIVGIPDSGNFKIGDTLTSGEKMMFKGMPSFAPELFRYIENGDPLKYKQLAKGVEQLMDEGVAQLFELQFNGRKIIGTVGALQFDVIEHRLKNEYGASCRYEPLQLHKACWIQSDNKDELNDFKKRKYQYIAKDKFDRDVYLADSAYSLDMARSNFKDINFYFTSDLQS
jgi:peptide chain release factor 3